MWLNAVATGGKVVEQSLGSPEGWFTYTKRESASWKLVSVSPCKRSENVELKKPLDQQSLCAGNMRSFSNILS